MTDLVVVAVIAAVPAMAGVLVSLRNGRKVDVIHTLVNGNLLAVQEDLKAAHGEIAELRKILKALTEP